MRDSPATPWLERSVDPIYRCACGGNCPRCSAKTELRGFDEEDSQVQVKLRVGQPKDERELEADRIAGAIVGPRKPTPGGGAFTGLTGGSLVQRRENDEEIAEPETELLTRREPGWRAGGESAELTQDRTLPSVDVAAAGLSWPTAPLVAASPSAATPVPRVIQRQSRDEDDEREADEREADEPYQAKLCISAPGDPSEQEADRVARLVMSTPAPLIQRKSCPACKIDEELISSKLGLGSVPPDLIQREEEECPPKAEPIDEDIEAVSETISKKSRPGRGKRPVSLERGLSRARQRGRSLPAPTREYMGARFGFDFSSVRVHTDGEADSMSRRLHALAFTTGSDIFFATNQFRPGTIEGDTLIAHELTHVLQQTGGREAPRASAQLVQRRKRFWEDKKYLDDVDTPTGTVIHHKVEERLRTLDSALVTESPIPGAVRYAHYSSSTPAGFNLVGIADLYKSSPATKLIGIRGIREGTSVEDFQNMSNCAAAPQKNAKPCGTFGPTLGKKTGGVRPWNGDFPSKVQVGEIKPLSVSKVAAGIDQLGHYRKGLKAFVEKAHALNSGKTRSTITTATLTSLKIPPALDYRRFLSQYKTKGSGFLEIGSYRYWIYPLSKSGVYVYFRIPSNYDVKGYSKWIKDRRAELADLLKKLRGKKRKVPGTVGTKRRPGPPTATVAARTFPAPVRIGYVRPQIQRRKGPKRKKVNWSDLGKKWEKNQRGPWSKKVRRYLKAQGKALKKKAKIDDKIGLKGDTADPKLKRQIKDFEAIKLWSGPIGKVLGKVRFLLGATFDKVASIFEAMREKLRGVKRRVKGISSKGFGFGWRRTLIKVLVKGAKAAASHLVSESFQIFADCFNALVAKAVERFQEDASEKLASEICELKTRYLRLKTQVEAKTKALVENFDGLIKEISDAKKWIEIATNLITLIRAGVQVISCLSPPALGCLWGLVAQIGISAALDLVMGTEWFEQNIANPTVRKLIKKYAGKHYQALIDKALAAANLTEFASDVDACKIRPESESAFMSRKFVSGGRSGAALLQHRGRWERRHNSEAMKALREHMVGESGRRLKPSEVKKLLKELKGLSPDEIKAVLEKSRLASAGGKVSVPLAEAIGGLEGITKRGEGVFGPPSEPRPSVGEPPPEEVPKGSGEKGKGSLSSGKPGAKGSGPGAGKGPGGSTESDGGTTEEGRARFRAANVRSGSKRPSSSEKSPFRVAWGFDPKTKYTKGQIIEAIIDVYYGQDFVTIYDVRFVYLSQKAKKTSKGLRYIEYYTRFEKDWEVPAIGLYVLGGEGNELTANVPLE